MRMIPDTVAQQETVSNTANAGGDCVITVSAVTDEWPVLDWVTWSYNSDPSAGRLTIVDTTNNTTLHDIYITGAGPGGLFFSERGMRAPKGSAVTITLADGGANKTLNIQKR